MGKYGNYKLPRFADMMNNRKDEEVDENVEENEGSDHTESLAQILKMGEAGEDFVKLTIKTEDGEEIELKFDYDGMGMIHAEHNGQKYTIPVEINVEGEENEDEPQVGEPEVEEPCEDCKKHAGKESHKAHGAFAEFLAETYNGGPHPSANTKAYDLLAKDIEMLVDGGEEPQAILRKVKSLLGISNAPKHQTNTPGPVYQGERSILAGTDSEGQA